MKSVTLNECLLRNEVTRMAIYHYFVHRGMGLSLVHFARGRVVGGTHIFCPFCPNPLQPSKSRSAGGGGGGNRAPFLSARPKLYIILFYMGGGVWKATRKKRQVLPEYCSNLPEFCPNIAQKFPEFSAFAKFGWQGRQRFYRRSSIIGQISTMC